RAVIGFALCPLGRGPTAFPFGRLRPRQPPPPPPKMPPSGVSPPEPTGGGQLHPPPPGPLAGPGRGPFFFFYLKRRPVTLRQRTILLPGSAPVKTTPPTRLVTPGTLGC